MNRTLTPIQSKRRHSTLITEEEIIEVVIEPETTSKAVAIIMVDKTEVDRLIILMVTATSMAYMAIRNLNAKRSNRTNVATIATEVTSEEIVMAANITITTTTTTMIKQTSPSKIKISKHSP